MFRKLATRLSRQHSLKLSGTFLKPFDQVSFSDLEVAVGPQPRGEKYLKVSFLEHILEGNFWKKKCIELGK